MTNCSEPADALRALQKTPIELEIERQKAERDLDIDKLLDEVAAAAGRYEGIKVNKGQNIIDFGDRAHFDKGKHTLDLRAGPSPPGLRTRSFGGCPR